MPEDYKEVLESIKESLEEYQVLERILKLFLTDAIEASKEIRSLNDKVLVDSFVNIERGLIGEFTKAQATELGLLAIKEAICRTLDNIKSSFDNRVVSMHSLVNHSKEIYFSITDSIDFNILERRKELYNLSDLTRSFMTKRATTKLTPSITEQFGNTETVNNYLSRLGNALTYMSTRNHFENIETLFSNYNNSLAYIKALEENNANENNDKDFKVELKDISDSTLIEEAKDDIKTVKVTILKDNVTDALDYNITVIVPAIKNLTTSLNIIKTSLETKLPDPKEDIESILSKLKEAASSVAEFKLTINELESVSDLAINKLVARYNELVILDANIIEYIAKFNKDVFLLGHIYSIIDNITLQGVIGDNTKVV